MTNGPWRDARALVRSAGFAGAVPAIGGRWWRYLAAYERVVTPIIESIVERDSRYARDDLCGTCAKLCFLLAGYAELAGVPFRADVAVLGGAVARIYDDLIDERGSGAGDDLLTALFAGAPVEPAGPAERLLAALYRELERRLGRDRTDPVYRALAELHRVQLRSRHQRDPAIPRAALADITAAKGGQATVVLFALVRPAMPEPEVALVRELGAILQLVDDYVDTATDRGSGITTAATRGELSLTVICDRLRELRPAVRARFGRDQPLYAVVYLHLWLCLLRRHLPRWVLACAPARLLVSAFRALRIGRRAGPGAPRAGTGSTAPPGAAPRAGARPPGTS